MPVVIVTARGDETDRVVGLELGADDYVVKPFSPRELVARVRAVLRRTDRVETNVDVIRVKDLTLDVPRMRAEIPAPRSISLRPIPVSADDGIATWPGLYSQSTARCGPWCRVESYERAIDAHIKNIRRKLEPTPADPDYILTVYGVGYRFADE